MQLVSSGGGRCHFRYGASVSQVIRTQLISLTCMIFHCNIVVQNMNYSCLSPTGDNFFIQTVTPC